MLGLGFAGSMILHMPRFYRGGAALKGLFEQGSQVVAVLPWKQTSESNMNLMREQQDTWNGPLPSQDQNWTFPVGENSTDLRSAVNMIDMRTSIELLHQSVDVSKPRSRFRTSLPGWTQHVREEQNNMSDCADAVRSLKFGRHLDLNRKTENWTEVWCCVRPGVLFSWRHAVIGPMVAA